MRALGFDVTLHRLLAFGLAAFVAAVAGVLSVWYNRRITPGSINLEQTINLLIIAVIGGLYRLEGAWVGALAYALSTTTRANGSPRSERPRARALQHDHRARVPDHRPALSGGLVGIWEDVRDRLRGGEDEEVAARPRPRPRGLRVARTGHCQLKGIEEVF